MIRFCIDKNSRYRVRDISFICPSKHLLSIPYKKYEKILEDKEWNLEDFTLKSVSPIIDKCEQIIIEAIQIFHESIPKLIEDLRKEISDSKIKFEKSVKTKKLIDYLYGAIIQFDSLSK